jgi:hypothetical protein
MLIKPNAAGLANNNYLQSRRVKTKCPIINQKLLFIHLIYLNCNVCVGDKLASDDMSRK